MDNPNYQKAIDSFLSEWKRRDEYEGALLTGSYATGTQSSNSDIDIMIVLANEISWWERGNKKVDGFLLEYIADPYYFWQESFQNEYSSNQRMSINMFAIGKILDDMSGLVKALQEEAVNLMNKPLNKMSDREIEMAKYHIHDGMEKLINMKESSPEHYAQQYFLQLSKIINFYAGYHGITLPATTKMHNFLNDGTYRDKYLLQGFSDQEFVSLVNGSLKEYPSPDVIIRLSRYAIDKLGGIEIDGWTLRTEIMKK